MRSQLLLSTVILMLVGFGMTATVGVVAAESGVNKTLDYADTPITSISVNEVSRDDEPFTLSVGLNETARGNGTAVNWTYQICTNDLICLQPEEGEMNESSTAGVWVGQVMPPDEHTYVNYVVYLYWPDGGELRLPATGLGGKVWSSCWFDGEQWGGGECPDQAAGEAAITDDRTDEIGFSPAIGALSVPLIAALAAIALAVTSARPD